MPGNKVTASCDLLDYWGSLFVAWLKKEMV